MKPLLSKSRLDKMRRALYGRNVEAVFYSLTPAEGETEIGRITQGIFPIREKAKEDRSGTVRLLLSADSGIEREDLRIGAEVALTVGGQTTRYSILDLQSMQQLGSGYVLKLDPLQGATG